ncbi:MAG: DUF4350 domain-containing protein [Deltaproteobacteria bacterium]|nr:DUF4350 domain-containing protein [Deltaproteobacteria bacterium]
MSAERKRQLLLVVGLVALGALTLLAGNESRKTAPPSPVPTVTNAGPQGLEAAFLYLSARGQARTLETSFTELPADAKVLVTALPYATDVSEAERAAILAWVRQGGTLVVLGKHERGLGGAVRGELDPVFTALHLKNRDIGLAEIGKDVRSLLDSAARPDDLDVIPAKPAVPDPLLAGVGQLAVSSGRGFDAEPGRAVPLAVAGDSPVMLSVDLGQGRLVAFAGPDVLTNARLDLADNAQLLANLGALGPVLFDERHHREDPSEAALAMGRYYGAATLAAMVLAVVLAASTARRLGPLREQAAGRPRTSRDYAVQLGRLYARARAEPTLAQELLRDLRARARERAHLSPAADDAEVAHRLAQDDAARSARYQTLCARLEIAARGPLDRSGYAELARDAAQLGREL